jgi:protein disulfide-isomerase
LQLPVLANERAIPWNEDYEAAAQLAAATNRVLLLHFYTDNCPPCRLLEKKTFHDPALIDAFQQHLVPARINAEKRRDLATKFNITRWPTDVYLFPNGDEIYRGVSDQDPAVYTTKIKRIALRHRDWSIEQQAIARSTERRQDQMLAANTPQIQAEKPVYAGTAGHPIKSQAASWTQPQVANQAASPTSSASPKRVIDNPYIAQQPIQVPVSAPIQNANQPSAVAPSTAAATRATSNTSVNAPAPVVTPVVEKKSIPAQPVAAQRDVPSPTSSNVDAPEARFVVAETIGMSGFCPVSLIESVQQSNGAAWVAGSPAFAVRHRGRVYYCASDRARQVLLSDPDRYTPGLSGFDLVHFFKTGKLVDGNCKFGCIQPTTHRIFLFSTQENYQEFEREMENYTRLLERVTPERVANRSTETSLR